MQPEDIADLLKPSTPDLSARIHFIDKDWQDSELKVSGRFYYVALRDSLPTVDQLIQVAHNRMVNFALPSSRIAEARTRWEADPSVMDPIVELTTEARDLFIKTAQESGRSGELGEILLYMLLEWVFSAPIVARKMYLKTSQQMPVHGTDGIHMGYEDGDLVMYWGESKMHKNLGSALDDISSSIAQNAKDPKKRANEVRLVRANLDLVGFGADAREALKDYFDPYKPQSNKLRDCFACFAGFSAPLYARVAKLTAQEADLEFRKLYEKRVDAALPHIIKKLKDAGLDSFRFKYFLMPFPCVDDARERFQKKLWGAA